MGNVQAVTDFRRKRKENLIKVLGSCCCLCGYNKCVGALEFHHIEPKNKTYQLSSGNCHKLEDDLEEAKKCILVCSNCHREIHTTNIYKDVNLWEYQVYDYEYVNKLMEQSQAKEYKCSNCGTQITKYLQSGLCASCSQKNRAKIQNKPNREELKNLIRTMPFTKIAELYNCTDNAIRKWCDKENLPRKKSDIESYTDEQWVNI